MVTVLLAISDYHYHEKEAQKISDFIKKHHNLKNFSIKPFDFYAELTEEQKLQLLISIAESFEETMENKQRMIKFALGIIIADRKIAEQELTRFKILEKFWKFDTNNFIKELSSKSTKNIIDLENL